MRYIASIVLFLSFISCNEITKTEKKPKAEQEQEYEPGVTYDSIVKNVIIGDFDGDGKEDKLKELFVSSINNSSIDALPQLGYDSLVTLIHGKEPILSLTSKTKNIPELILTKSASFGIMWLKNEGDLNKDGTDEISVVIDWADWSQVNSCIVYSLKNKLWIKYAKFKIREWQISQNSNFNGFISKKEKGIYNALTFDSEGNEILKPLNEVLVVENNSKLSKLLLNDFKGIPDEIDGCSCYFSETKNKFKNGEYLFATGFDSIGFVSVANKRVKLKLVSSERKPTDFGDYDHLDIYHSELYEVTVDIKYKDSNGDETWWNEGIVTIESKDGYKISKKFVGECGC